MRRALILVAVAGCSFQIDAPSVTTDADVRFDVVFMDSPSSSDAPPDWWDPQWRWRMPLVITNSAATPLAVGFEVGFGYDLDAAPCTGDPNDSRIVRGTTEIARVIDRAGPTEWTWFPIQAAIPAAGTATDYWLYCGNTTPPAAPSDPEQVFTFYDDFSEAALDTTLWTTKNTVALSNGKLVAGGTNVRDHGIVTTTLAFPKNHAVDFIAIASSTTASDFWAGFQNGTPDVAPWLHWYTRNNNAICPDFLGVATDTPWYGTDVPLDTAPHLYTVENYGTSSLYRRDNVVFQTHIYAPMAPPPALVNVRLWNGSNTTTVAYDMVRVRHAVLPLPVVAVGSPQTY